jgi:NitT/TauT family transport system ATP-binding protein
MSSEGFGFLKNAIGAATNAAPIETGFIQPLITQNAIEFTNVSQVYPDGKSVFENLNFAIDNNPNGGQFVALMGESGCGKSTLLRYIAGLQKPSSGEVKIFDQALVEDSHFPMVFQRYTSLEWNTVLDNVRLPLQIQGLSKADQIEKAMNIIKIVGLDGHEKKYAKYPTLSGGQLQRVAIARSLLANPKVLLLDEPFGALDIRTRSEMQNFLLKMFADLESQGIDPTFLLVTHDPQEAVYLAKDIYILGGSPASVTKHIKVDFVQRDNSIKRSQKFMEQVMEIDELFTVKPKK